jgi:putative membrane protein
MREIIIAYCGPAAVPETLWTRWITDPVLIAGLILFALLVGRSREGDRRAGWAAIALMVVVFVSPLCALASALFSARVLHHVLLVAAVAPLLAWAFPLRRLGSLPLGLLVAVHAVVMWFWHAPGAYSWGLATVWAYWLMQATLLGSAWLLWRGIFSTTVQRGAAMVALAVTIGQMGLLGALLVFAPRPLYAEHLASTFAWGLGPLADQQLAGLLMWVPAMLPYLAVGLTMAWSGLRTPDPQAT